MAKFIIEIRSKGFSNVKKRIDETTVGLRKQTKQTNLLAKANARLRQTTDGITRAFGVFRNKLLLVTFAMGLVTAALRKFTEVTRAAELEDLARGFTSLRIAAGLTADTLQELREATNGTVTDMELMRQANNAMLLGVARSTDELAEMFDNAQRLGRVLGKDATTSLESFVTGLGRQSRLMLDNVGLMIKTNEAYEAYAEANKMTVAEMTDMDKKIAFINAGLTQSREKVAVFGEEVLSSSDKIRQADVQMQHFADTLSIGFSGGFEILSTGLGNLAETLAQMVRNMTPATFATKDLELKAHALKMEIANLKLQTDQQTTATKELTDEEKKLKKRQDKRIATLKFAIIDSKALLGVEKEMLREKLGLRDAITSQEMALLSLLDTQTLAMKLNGKQAEFEAAQAEITKRQREMQAQEEEQGRIDLLTRIKEMQEKLSVLTLAFLDEQIELEENAENEKARIRKTAAEDLEQQFKLTASAITTVSGALQVLANKGATAEEKMKSILTTIGALMMQSGTGSGVLGGSILQAFAGFIGHTGGLIQNNGIQRFATGGMVQGQDNVPILAQSGEFIMQRSAVNSIGLQNLAQMNNTGEPSGGMTINISGDMIGDEDHVRTKVLPAIREELRREANA